MNIKRQIEGVLRSHQDNDSPALNAALELLCDSLEVECPECERTVSDGICYSCSAADYIEADPIWDKEYHPDFCDEVCPDYPRR